MLKVLVVHMEDHMSETVASEVGDENSEAVKHCKGLQELDVLLPMPVWDAMS